MDGSFEGEAREKRRSKRKMARRLAFALAGCALFSRQSVSLEHTGKRRMSLKELSSVWRTAAERDLGDDNDTLGLSVELEWESFRRLGETERAPFVVCTERDPAQLQAARNIVGAGHHQLVYSRPDKACLVLHANAADIDTLEELQEVQVLHPLSHVSKMSHHLSHSPAVLEHSHQAAGAWTLAPALDVSLAPGVRSAEAFDAWQEELKGGVWREGSSASEVFVWGDAGGRRLLEGGGAHEVAVNYWRDVRERVGDGSCMFDGLHVEAGEGSEVLQSSDRLVVRGTDQLGHDQEQSAHCLQTLLAYLSTRKDVVYVDVLPAVLPQNIEASWVTQSGTESAYPIWDAGIQGSTEVIAIADSGLDMRSCFFAEPDEGEPVECSTYTTPVTDHSKRKVIQYVGYVDCEDEQDGHGTHVVGTAAGAIHGAESGGHLGDGVGFGSKVAFFDFGGEGGSLSTPSNIAAQLLWPGYSQAGARISSNSWGAVRTTYTSLDRQFDDFAYYYDDELILVAGGNCGDISSGCESFGTALYGQGSILSPGLAKNVLTVGASESSASEAGLADNISEVAYFSSQGPLVDDGRIKPDVVAPGYHLFSASANPEEPGSCKVEAMAGTSMATPVVAGLAAMIRQYFLQGWWKTGNPSPSDVYNPSGALVKAMLVSSAVGMSLYDGLGAQVSLSSPPDGYQGWGRVLVSNVMDLYGSVHLFIDDRIEMNQGDLQTYSFDQAWITTDGGVYEGDFTATLVFFEPAAGTGSVAPVLNDLDLEVVAVSSGGTTTTFYPNGFSAPDPGNTVEKIVIPNVQSYTLFTVNVRASSVTTTGLPFYALVVTGGQHQGYSPTQRSYGTNEWQVRAELSITGTPPEEATTENFATALAEALSDNTGAITSPTSTSLVAVKKFADDTASSLVSVEVQVANESDGIAVLSYIESLNEPAGASAFVGSTNDLLAGYTTSGCICVSVGADYDCTACVDNTAYSSITAVGADKSDLRLVSSSTASSANSSDGEAGETSLRDEVLRTSTSIVIIGVVATVVAFSAIMGLAIWRYGGKETGDPADDAYTRLATSAVNRS